MERIKYADRDQKQFAEYGFGVEKLAAFKRLCQAFSEMPSDDELVGEQMVFTEKKNEVREELKTAIRSLMTRVSQRYPIKSGRYRKFGTYKMNDMSDAKLVLCGRRVARVAEQQLPYLHDTGLRQLHIDKVRQASGAFENSIHLQQDKVADRDIAVERRTEKGNEVYQQLVQLCNIGKDIWAEVDTTKYEHYTIYESNNEQKKARKKRLAEEAGNED